MNDNTKTIVDAVFVIGTGSKNNNEELKYALRNLDRNCPFIRDVYICGECPDWVDTSVVKHLKWPDRFHHAKDANIIDKLRHACEQPGISENILFCSDDQFVTHPCTWEDFAPRYLRRFELKDTWYEDRKRIWHSRLRQTLLRERNRREKLGFEVDLDHIFYYQPHMWMQINRDKFIEYAKWCDYEHSEHTIIASGYFNFINAPGELNHDHIFITSATKWPVKETHVAYTDSSFQNAMSFLRNEYPEACRLEKAHAGKDHAVLVQREIVTPAPPTVNSASTNDDKISSIRQQIISDPVWAPLIPEMEEADEMREKDASNWKAVWNDIITRWAKATNRGQNKVAVPPNKSTEALIAVAKYRNSKPWPKAAEASQTTEVPKKSCSKCEERRRKAKEEAEKRKAELAETVRASKPVNAFFLKDSSPNPLPPPTKTIDLTGGIGKPHLVEVIDTIPETGSETIPKNTACEDCAREHLSVAIAYLGSNLSRPSSFEIELAKGEVTVASEHLLALKRTSLYNRCVEALDSMHTPESTFSVGTFKGILRELVEAGV